MMEADLLSEVKTRLSVTGDYHDSLLMGYIEDVKAFLKSAGISDDTLNSEASIGVIARGVSDLWVNFKFSEFFFQRAIQLACEGDNHE